MTLDDHDLTGAATVNSGGTPLAAEVDQMPGAPSAKTRSAWWTWRHSRPFWGAVLLLLGGAEILASIRAPLPVMLRVGMQGLAMYLVPVVLLLCGLLLLFNPAQRHFYAILAILLSLASWLTSNLGGFFVGMLLGLIGGSLAFAWAPRRPVPGGRRRLRLVRSRQPVD